MQGTGITTTMVTVMDTVMGMDMEVLGPIRILNLARNPMTQVRALHADTGRLRILCCL